MPVIRPLTKSQLASYFLAYREAFPDWEVEHDVVLNRTSGHVKQRIGFEALRSGAYRPSCWVVITPTPPYCHILNQWLDKRHEQVLPREHAAKMPQILRAMENQFLPPIRQPLNTAIVLQLAEEEVARDMIDKTNYSVALATLNALIGRFDRAAWWCNRVPEQLVGLGRLPTAWEQRHADYVLHLREAIRQRRTEEFFESR